MNDFKEVLAYCDLSDILAEGKKFTWSNKRQGADLTKEKLDRVVATPSAMDLLLGSFYTVLPQLKSDHYPLIINLIRLEGTRSQRRHIFRFEAAWQLSKECSQLIKEAWDQSTVGI